MQRERSVVDVAIRELQGLQDVATVARRGRPRVESGWGVYEASIVVEPVGEFGNGAVYGWIGHSGHGEGYLLDLDDGGFTASATTSKR